MYSGAKGQLFAELAVALDEPFYETETRRDALVTIAFVEIGQNAAYVYGAMVELDILPVDNKELVGILGASPSAIREQDTILSNVSWH